MSLRSFLSFFGLAMLIIVAIFSRICQLPTYGSRINFATIIPSQIDLSGGIANGYERTESTRTCGSRQDYLRRQGMVSAFADQPQCGLPRHLGPDCLLFVRRLPIDEQALQARHRGSPCPRTRRYRRRSAHRHERRPEETVLSASM